MFWSQRDWELVEVRMKMVRQHCSYGVGGFWLGPAEWEHSKWQWGEPRPAWVYLDGQLMREWVSPSASVWKNQSVLSFALALHQWETREWVNGWIIVHNQLCSWSAHTNTQVHYTNRWLYIEPDHSENELGLEQDKESASSTKQGDISLLLLLWKRHYS